MSALPPAPTITGMNPNIRVFFEAAFWLNLIFTFEKPPLMPFVGHVAVGLALTWYWAWCRGREAAALDRDEREAYAESFSKPLVWLYIPMFFVMNSGSVYIKSDTARFVVVLLLVRLYLFLDRQSID
ncbi:hypothetical protein [Synechococcus sp. EJ6-Ellesmere]|uniref:hypothetical protein n=1 Tax=Synechococcus sp. EJ6-Ellesmere TaxID=2823734 RepID=UPI0020CCF734|nr:hypothetical protein [Synechococcus sp. EJ6-Ellesmere]MCP9826104.1 hypothetical protein [Synechococcus sp. EJ6-Ellesmere]